MKFFLRFFSIILLILLISSFGPVKMVENTPSYTYTGDKAIYPAVHYAIVHGTRSTWSNSTISVPEPNTVIIDHVQVSDGIKLADFTLEISLINNVVTYQFSNIKEKLPVGSAADWLPVEKFFQSDRELIFTSYFNKEIPKIMENETLYAKAKEAADKSMGGPPRGGSLIVALALQNPQNYLLYPAVGAAFNDLKGILGAKTAVIRDIDCLDNQFTIQDCVAERKSNDLIKYRIKITYKSNQLNIEFINIEPIGSTIMQYTDKELNMLQKFETQKISDQLKAQIERYLTNTNAYNAAKKAFLENNAFLKRAIEPITKVLLDDFVAALFKGGEIGLNATILDVKKNDTSEYKNLGIIISAGLYTEPSGSSAFALITLYTNDSNLARLKQHEKIMLNGQFIRMEYKTALYPTIVMTK